MASNVYLIELRNNKENFYKIGTTVHKYCRFYQIMKRGYDADIIYMALGLDMLDAYDIESKLGTIFHLHSYMPLIKFGGYTECYQGIDIECFKGALKSMIHTDFEVIENYPLSCP